MTVLTPLDAETRSIVDATLERFVDDQYQPAPRLARLRLPAVDYRQHWGALAELGILGTTFPESLGGLGGCAVDVAHTVRVLSRALVLEPLVECAVIAASILAAASDNPDHRKHVDALASGELVTILLGGRPGMGDALHCHARSDAYVLSGALRVVAYAQQADQWLVAARDSASGETVIFRMGPQSTTWAGGSYRLLDGHPACDITFHDLLVPTSSVWLTGRAADAALERAALLATAAYGAETAGILAQLVAMTGSYLTTRVQFGVALSNFQALQHRYADMHIEALECGALTRAFAAAIDRCDEAHLSRLRLAVRISAAHASERVGQEAIQMHGGTGMTEELVVSHYNARLLVLAGLVAAWTPAAIADVAEASL